MSSVLPLIACVSLQLDVSPPKTYAPVLPPFLAEAWQSDYCVIFDFDNFSTPDLPQYAARLQSEAAASWVHLHLHQAEAPLGPIRKYLQSLYHFDKPLVVAFSGVAAPPMLQRLLSPFGNRLLLSPDADVLAHNWTAFYALHTPSHN
ncbi:hypothetical protein [Eisenibacter elegans]|jgi:hypothetical protein|uniref:hypothetical protein n=1 Tax=Eisenibacter elegans TaxID=997 RepID=UPI0004244584|nr:hypothetical protein [Eisenibacter elegans]